MAKSILNIDKAINERIDIAVKERMEISDRCVSLVKQILSEEYKRLAYFKNRDLCNSQLLECCKRQIDRLEYALGIKSDCANFPFFKTHR